MWKEEAWRTVNSAAIARLVSIVWGVFQNYPPWTVVFSFDQWLAT